MEHSFKVGQYYVYHHVYQDKIFYVGMGKGKRAFSTIERSLQWKKIVASIPGGIFEIKIMKTFDNEKDAAAFEKSEILRLRPAANINFVTRRPMTVNEAGALGAMKTNKVLTSAGRSKAAKKGWRRRKQKNEQK